MAWARIYIWQAIGLPYLFHILEVALKHLLDDRRADFPCHCL